MWEGDSREGRRGAAGGGIGGGVGPLGGGCFWFGLKVALCGVTAGGYAVGMVESYARPPSRGGRRWYAVRLVASWTHPPPGSQPPEVVPSCSLRYHGHRRRYDYGRLRVW